MMETDKYIRSEDNQGAVINTDHGALQTYKEQKKLAKKRNQEFDEMRKDLDLIKSMLLEIIESNNK